MKTPIIMQGYFRDRSNPGRVPRRLVPPGELVRRDEEAGSPSSGAERTSSAAAREHIGRRARPRDRRASRVHEAAAIAVASELGEDEILAAVS